MHRFFFLLVLLACTFLSAIAAPIPIPDPFSLGGIFNFLGSAVKAAVPLIAPLAGPLAPLVAPAIGMLTGGAAKAAPAPKAAAVQYAAVPAGYAAAPAAQYAAAPVAAAPVAQTYAAPDPATEAPTRQQQKAAQKAAQQAQKDAERAAKAQQEAQRDAQKAADKAAKDAQRKAAKDAQEKIDQASEDARRAAAQKAAPCYLANQWRARLPGARICAYGETPDQQTPVVDPAAVAQSQAAAAASATAAAQSQAAAAAAQATAQAQAQAAASATAAAAAASAASVSAASAAAATATATPVADLAANDANQAANYSSGSPPTNVRAAYNGTYYNTTTTFNNTGSGSPTVVNDNEPSSGNVNPDLLQPGRKCKINIRKGCSSSFIQKCITPGDAYANSPHCMRCHCPIIPGPNPIPYLRTLHQHNS